jgi:hypothetical protein
LPCKLLPVSNISGITSNFKVFVLQNCARAQAAALNLVCSNNFNHGNPLFLSSVTGQTQCQRLPHEWGLGKGITEAKCYLRRNSAERQLRSKVLSSVTNEKKFNYSRKASLIPSRRYFIYKL